MKLPSDWSDVLSPVVVKEIRQGVRAKVFVGAFLITQILMVFSVFLSLMSDGRDADGATVFFWVLVSLPLLCIMPARGLQAVGAEIRDETIDLVFLSRLSAWRIVVGKWAALTAQSLLLVSSLLPYLVLRYFIGSVNLLEELLVLGMILATSILLCAGAVGISAFQPKGKKGGPSIIGLVVLGLIGLMTLGPGITYAMRRMMGGGASSAGSFSSTYACLAFLGPMLVLFLLQIGASKIAPPAENHAWRKRLTALVTMGIAILLSLSDVARPFPFIFACFILGVTIIDGICEPIPRIYSIFLPFAKRGLGGRLLGRFLYPGWASGTIFGLAAVTGLYVWACLHPVFGGEVTPTVYVATMGIVFWPLALIRLFRPDAKRPLAIYCAIHAITAVMAVVAVILSQATKNDILSEVLAIIPLAYLIIDNSSVAGVDGIFLVGGSVMLLFTLTVLLWRAREAFVSMDALVAEVSGHQTMLRDKAIAEAATSAGSLPPQNLGTVVDPVVDADLDATTGIGD